MKFQKTMNGGGEGFTEWTNVKKARPLYEGHLQPRIPLNEYYYDLSEPEELIRQMNLAKNYGVDGFCFYHYWFNGKKLLEKPLEQLLNRTDIPIEYCLCWANEPWTRTWDGDRGAKQILMPQYYGGEAEWREHFLYLNQFFRQDKYIKKNGMPILIIYKASDIPNREKMISLWKRLAVEEGYEGLFIINVHRQHLHNEIPFYGDAVMNFEPFASLRLISIADQMRITIPHQSIEHNNIEKIYHVWDYEEFCKLMVNRYTFSNRKHYLMFAE